MVYVLSLKKKQEASSQHRDLSQYTRFLLHIRTRTGETSFSKPYLKNTALDISLSLVTTQEKPSNHFTKLLQSAKYVDSIHSICAIYIRVLKSAKEFVWLAQEPREVHPSRRTNYLLYLTVYL